MSFNPKILGHNSSCTYRPPTDNELSDIQSKVSQLALNSQALTPEGVSRQVYQEMLPMQNRVITNMKQQAEESDELPIYQDQRTTS